MDIEGQSIESSVGAVLTRLERTSAVRDAALIAGRQAIRCCANSIRDIHRGEIGNAQEQLSSAKSLLDQIRKGAQGEPSVYWAGYVQDAMKEYAEATTLFAIVVGKSMPTPNDIGVEDAPFLNGICEAASELRRLVLYTLQGDEIEPAERFLAAMNDIYDVLITVDYPDAITGGLRRSVDHLRSVLERTRGDFTLTVNQRRLEAALTAFQVQLDRR